MRRLASKLKKWLSSDGTRRLEVVFGDLTDRAYVDAMATAAKAAPLATRGYFLSRSTPLINFMVLDFADGHHEVLFGWGNRDANSGSSHDSIFLSRDGTFIDEFSKLFALLKDRADKYVRLDEWDVQTLSTAKIAAFYPWEQARYLELTSRLATSKKKVDLRICTTLFHSLFDLNLPAVLPRCRIRIIMINPANQTLLKARFLHRADFDLKEALKRIKSQLKELGRIAPNRDLQVRLSDAMPSGITVITPQTALIGVMFADYSYARGPMIEAERGTELWTRALADWKIRWDAGKQVVPIPSRAKGRARR